MPVRVAGQFDSAGLRGATRDSAGLHVLCGDHDDSDSESLDLWSSLAQLGFAAGRVCELVTMACVSLAVEGMMCQRNCGTTVRNALLGVSGVSRAEVSHADKCARVWGAATAEALIDAVEAVGFGASIGPVPVERVQDAPPATGLASAHLLPERARLLVPASVAAEAVRGARAAVVVELAADRDNEKQEEPDQHGRGKKQPISMANPGNLPGLLVGNCRATLFARFPRASWRTEAGGSVGARSPPGCASWARAA